MREGYSTQFVCQSVSHSVTQQKSDLEVGSLSKIERKKKHQDIALDILSLFNVSEFLEKASLFEAV